MKLDRREPAPAERRTVAANAGGLVERSAKLADDVILLLGAFPLARRRRPALWLRSAGRWTRIEARVLAAGGDRAAHGRALVLATLPPAAAGIRGPMGQLAAGRGRERTLLAPTDIGQTLVDVSDLLDDHLARSAPAVRARVMEALLAAASERERPSFELCAALRRVRDSLRDPLRPAAIDPAAPRTLNIDAIWRIDERAFYVEGWARSTRPGTERLVAVTPEGERVELTARAFRYPRPDVAEFCGLPADDRTEKPGVVAFFETRTPSLLPEGWIFELRDADGGVEAAAPRVHTDLRAARATIMGDLALERLPAERLRVEHIMPAVTAVQRRLIGDVAIDGIEQYGEPPGAPTVSVIVPLYRRVDFLEHQLAQFVHDPELCGADLIYVLDSPEQAEYLASYAGQLHRLYGVPFRVVTLTKNGGFSAVNNLGASVARGRLLLLMNSDVLPDRPGWLGDLVRFHDSIRNAGATAPMLLYEDDSLQHAGLYFDRPPGGHVWANEHYFKGLHRTLPAANRSRPVAAVTAACMLIDADLYQRFGGLRGIYVQGDYEDSDLCLRLADAGYENWYFAGTALYHLEGQSYPSAERTLASEYNKWLHTYTWRSRLAAMEASEGA